MEDLTGSEICNFIARGIYKVKVDKKGQYAGGYYRVLSDIYNEQNERVKHFYQCTKCKEVLKCNPSNGTKPLNKHANKCDPQKKGKSYW